MLRVPCSALNGDQVAAKHVGERLKACVEGASDWSDCALFESTKERLIAEALEGRTSTNKDALEMSGAKRPGEQEVVESLGAPTCSGDLPPQQQLPGARVVSVAGAGTGQVVSPERASARKMVSW